MQHHFVSCGKVLVVQAVLLMVLLPAAARSEHPARAAPQWVLQAGQEELLADLLGRGVLFPDSCKLASGQITGTMARATYDCAVGTVVLELHHPSEGGTVGAVVAKTNAFIIVAPSGEPPAPLLEALTTRIRAGESKARWMAPESSRAPSPTSVPRSSLPAPSPPWLVGGASLFAILIAAVMAALWRSRRHIVTDEAIIPALLALLALALRMIAHGGPADIRPVLGEHSAHSSRAGWVAFIRLVYAILPSADETFWSINRVAGAVSVCLLYVAVRRRFADRIVAIGAATALAVTPLIVRFSASDTPYILLCCAFLGAVVTFDRFVESKSVVTLILALGLLSAAMQLRPDTPWLIGPAILVVLAGPLPSRSTMRSATTIAALLVFLLFNFVPTLWAVGAHASGGYWREFVLIGSLVGSPWATTDMTPRLLAALIVVGAVAAPFYGKAGFMWLLAVLVANPLDFPAYTPGTSEVQYANARYHLPAMHLACGLAGVAIATLLRSVRAAVSVPVRALVAVSIVLLAALPRIDLLQRMWTPQSEYDFFRDAVRRIDATCDVVTLADTADSGWVPFDYLVPDDLLDARHFLAAPAADGCVVYYRCATCYASDLVPREERANFEMNATCREVEDRFRLEPVVEALIPALPYRGEKYVRDPLPVGLYRLTPKAPR